MGKEKKQYPKITKKSLDYLDEVEKNREVTFQSLDVFGRAYYRVISERTDKR